MPSVPYRLVARASDLSVLEAVASHPALAVDLEADSLHSYREKICLVQLSTPAENLILDPVEAKGVLDRLAPLLEDPQREKVFHGADYDIRLLKKQGTAVTRIFDTMIAAQLTGRGRFGLAALLEEHFGVQADKRYQKADWSARPLSSGMLEYAALDTAYLLPLRERLGQELLSLGRLGWAEEEFRLLEQVQPAPPRAPWCLDTKGSSRLTPPQLAVLQGLLEVREAEAHRRDVPPFKVLPPAVLLQWSQTPPRNRGELLATKGADRRSLASLADRLLEAVEAARALPPDAWPRPAPGTYTPMEPQQKKLLDRLKKARLAAAERLRLDPGLLVNGATLERIARQPPAEGGPALESYLKRWQEEAVAGDLQRALAGS